MEGRKGGSLLSASFLHPVPICNIFTPMEGVYLTTHKTVAFMRCPDVVFRFPILTNFFGQPSQVQTNVLRSSTVFQYESRQCAFRAATGPAHLTSQKGQHTCISRIWACRSARVVKPTPPSSSPSSAPCVPHSSHQNFNSPCSRTTCLFIAFGESKPCLQPSVPQTYGF